MKAKEISDRYIYCASCDKETKARNSGTTYCSRECRYESMKLKELPSIKRCPQCRENKPISEYYRRGVGYQAWCKICQTKREDRKPRHEVTCDICGIGKSIAECKVDTWRCASCKREIAKESNGGYSRYYKGSRFISSTTISAWKLSAARRGHEWAINKEDLDSQFLKQKGLCALSGLEMTLSKRSSYRPSLDRIDSTKGYTPDNIQFVCSIVNVMKNKFDEPLFISMCKSISEFKSEDVSLEHIELPPNWKRGQFC